MEYKRAVEAEVSAVRNAPIDILGIGDSEGEARYLSEMSDSYTRTIRDVDGLFKANRDKKILEVGSFLGVVSLSLKKLGYEVSACDIPEFHQSAALRALYEQNGVPFSAVNLRKYELPYESGSFDAIIICEVLEHLNFNPLPVIAEFNRVLRPGGYLYIGMPNQAALSKRIGLLLGKSYGNPISDLFAQLDRQKNMLVGLHWREYTLAETTELIERMGFQTVNKYYYAKESRRLLTSLMKKIVYAVPSFRPYLVVIGRKASEHSENFWITDANR